MALFDGPPHFRDNLRSIFHSVGPKREAVPNQPSSPQRESSIPDQSPGIVGRFTDESSTNHSPLSNGSTPRRAEHIANENEFLQGVNFNGSSEEGIQRQRNIEQIKANRRIHLETLKDVTDAMRILTSDKKYELILTREDRTVLLRTLQALLSRKIDLATDANHRFQDEAVLSTKESKELHDVHFNLFIASDYAHSLLRNLIIQAARNTVFLQGGAIPAGTLMGVCKGEVINERQVADQKFENFIFGGRQVEIIKSPELRRELGLSVYVLRLALRASPRSPELLTTVGDALLLARNSLRGNGSLGLKIGAGINHLLIMELPSYLAHNPGHTSEVEKFLGVIGVEQRFIPHFMSDLKKSSLPPSSQDLQSK